MTEGVFCIVWAGPLTHGYGPYRRAYRRRNGAVPRGHHIHHLCRNRRCIQPRHLVTIPKREHFILTFLVERGRTIEDVFEIRALGRQGVPARELARRYGLGRRTVDGILNGEVWAAETGGERIRPETACAVCRTPLRGHRHQVYCGKRCRDAAFRARKRE
jgi:hypothetical protein